jgi:hypothetical protein
MKNSVAIYTLIIGLIFWFAQVARGQRRNPSGENAMIRRTVIVVIAATFVGLLVFVFLSWRPAIAPIERPNPASFTAKSVSKGESSGRSRTLCVVSYPAGWTIIRRWIRSKHAIRDHLRE